MTKQDFLETLGKILNRELSEAEVKDNLQYYDTYITQQMAKGRTQEEVLSELGDPRLIARTILQVDTRKEEGSSGQIFTEEEDGSFRHSPEKEGNGSGGRIHVHSFGGVKAWLILIAALLLFFFLLHTAFTLAIRLLPVILVVSLVVWLVRR